QYFQRVADFFLRIFIRKTEPHRRFPFFRIRTRCRQRGAFALFMCGTGRCGRHVTTPILQGVGENFTAHTQRTSVDTIASALPVATSADEQTLHLIASFSPQFSQMGETICLLSLMFISFPSRQTKTSRAR